MKNTFIKIGPFLIGSIVLFMLLSLHFGWLDVFFFGAEHAKVQGIDYFAVPKSFLNLLEGRSAFDTWGGQQYGPYSTWYLAHPAFSVFVASWFSFFTPWLSYLLFILFSLLIMVYTAHFISKHTNSQFQKTAIYFVLLCAFPTYWMLYVGNMHAPLVLALAMILIGILNLTYGPNSKEANRILLAGLLISFFTKPIVLLMLPVLLMVKETRRTTIKSLLMYSFVSMLFLIVPILNPQSIGWNKMLDVMFDFDFIKANMNIFKNNFVLNEYMKDNSIHWLNLIAQSEYKLMHIDVFSLPVFVDTIMGAEVSARLFKLPIYMSLLLSFCIPFIKDVKLKLESLLLLIIAISLTFFLSYNTVWEYQFASVLPVICVLIVLKSRNVFYAKMLNGMIFISLIICLPSLYFVVRGGDFQTASSLTLIRITRVVPVVLLFLLVVINLLYAIRLHAKFQLPKFPTLNQLFFD
jgi:hypothetical protein